MAFRWLRSALACSIPLVALVYALDLSAYFGVALLEEQFLGVVLTAVLVSVFLTTPARRGAREARVPWHDVVLSLLSVAAGGYLAVYYPAIVNEAGELTWDKVTFGAIALLLVLEACRRLTGWWLVALAAVFILYVKYADFFPGLLNARGASWSKIAVHLYIDPNALTGTPLSIVATTVVPFILFGQILYATGGGQFFTDLAMIAMGRFRGGAAKIAVLGSGLFGMISGSPVANVMVEGSITIPMMIRTGYQRHVAGAIEAVAANGGQIMPPVMGAAAFVMAEFLNVPYSEVAIAAFVPALLYYLALFVQVDLEAGRAAIARLPAASIPSLVTVVRFGWIFIVPIAVILYLLFFLNMSAAKAGFYATGAALVVTAFRPNVRIGPRRLLTILESTGVATLELAVVCAVAGLVEGVLHLTGLAFVFTVFAERLGAENLILILVITALIELVLGLPLPTTAVYVLVALTLAPVLVKMGIAPMAAHMFVFYYAMLSLITPPIATTAFAAAALAGSGMMRTGWECMRLALIAYVIPFIFVFDPLLLMKGAPHMILLAIAAASVGTFAVGVAVVGYFVRPVGRWKRLVLGLGGFGLMIPPGGAIRGSWTIPVVAGAACLAVLLHERRARAAAAR